MPLLPKNISRNPNYSSTSVAADGNSSSSFITTATPNSNNNNGHRLITDQQQQQQQQQLRSISRLSSIDDPHSPIPHHYSSTVLSLNSSLVNNNNNDNSRPLSARTDKSTKNTKNLNISNSNNNLSTMQANAQLTARRLRQFQSTNTDKSSFVAGKLVADTIVPQKQTQQKQKSEVEKFKLDVCTPRRQRAAAVATASRNSLLSSSSLSIADTSSSSMIPSPPSARGGGKPAGTINKAAAALEQQNKKKKGTETITSVKSQIETFVMNFASEQQRYDRRRNDLEKEKAKQRLEFNLEKNKKSKYNSASDDGADSSALLRNKNNHDSNGHRQRRRGSSAISHHQHENTTGGSSGTATKSDDDEDDRSSTDSTIMDPTVVTATIARNSNRRANRLRDHFSAPLDTLNQTAANASLLVLSSAAAGGAGGDSSCVLMSYMMGLERLVQFSFNTLGSKDELAGLIEAMSGRQGLQESASSFGRWPCFSRPAMDSRLEKVLPVAFDRHALFDTFGGVLRDGRVVHACLLAGLRLMYFAPSPAHFTEFILTVLFVHQSSLSQADCQTFYRILTNPHPLRFLVRGRKDNTQKIINLVRTQNSKNAMDSHINSSLYSPACDVNRKVAGEELYYLIDFLSTASTFPGSGGCTISWADLQRLVSPNEDDLVLTSGAMSDGINNNKDGNKTTDEKINKEGLVITNNSSSSNVAGSNEENRRASSYFLQDEKPLSSTEKEEERKRERQHVFARQHEVAMESRRKAARGDVFAGSTNKRSSPSECVIIAKLMSEMKAP